MARELYKDCLKRVLVHEGGKVDHPRDPGGRTNQGVIQRVYDAYRRRKKQKPRDVWTMTNAERDEIYRVQYWDVIRGDELPAGIDYVVFDGAVNSGPSQSVKWLQRALGMSTVDGHLGESTLQAAINHPDHDALVNAICDKRMAFLKALRTFPTFGKGWTRRVAEVRRNGLALARGRQEIAPVSLMSADAFEEGGNARANLQDAVPAPQTATADAAAAGGAMGGAGGAGAIDTAKDALHPITGQSKWIDLAFTVLVSAGVAITVGGLLWGLYARRRRRERADALDLTSEGVS